MNEKKNDIALKDLRAQLADLKGRHSNLADDDLFVAWFLRAYITENEEEAVSAIVGGPGDKGLDAILIDERARAVFLVQSKYRKAVEAKSELRSDVISFAQLAAVLSDDDSTSFVEFTSRLNSRTKTALSEARKKVLKSDFRVWLYYVTLGRVTPVVERDAKAIARKAKCNASLEVLAGKRIIHLLSDYLDGAAPPIPTVDLEMESGAAITVNGVLQRYDKDNEVESWAFPMRGSSIAHLVDATGLRLFARNVRGFLGDSPVNRGMLDTLSHEPDYFFYYNNGITIICDNAERVSRGGKDILRVSNPQIINGQQTARVLSRPDVSGVGKASVLVKVIRVPRDVETARNGSFDVLVSSIVSATNWQNSIRPSDLMSNDRRQIQIERDMRKVGYAYLRKRMTKTEARKVSGSKSARMLSKENLAQAVAGCELDPVIARSGKDNLFEEQLYNKIFGHSDVSQYLARYWLAHEVTLCSRGYPQRGYAKWLVLGFLWSRIGPGLQSNRIRSAFREACEARNTAVLSPLWKATNRVYKAALNYYNANKGRGKSVMDVSLFFRSKKGRDREFEEFWKRLKKADDRATRADLEEMRTILLSDD